MNGRIYDPLIGRMLSADTDVPYPGDLQSFNRYSYVRNSPLGRVDPTGFADIDFIDRSDSAHRGAMLVPEQDPDVTTIVAHGSATGGFSADRAGSQPVSFGDIDAAMSLEGHIQGHEIRAYICYGGVGSNRTVLAQLALKYNSPVVAATGAVDPVDPPRGGPVIWRGSEVKGGKWIVINPDGSVRDYGTPANAKRAADQASKAQASATAATAAADRAEVRATQTATAATQAATTATQARAAADAAKGTPNEKAEAKNAKRAETAAQKAQNAANKARGQADDAAAKAAEAARKAQEAAERARQLADEASRPL